MTRRPALTLAVVAIALTLSVHWPALDIQFWVDEFSDLRPWSSAELLSALTGSWDPRGASEPYYRPLTALYQAAGFEWFGFNPRSHHVLSLLLTAVSAWLLGRFAWSETGRPEAGIAATAIFVLHPALPDAASAPIKLQMHLIGCALAGLTLLAWRRARREAPTAWWPVWLVVMVACGFKEDAVMLAVAVPALQWIHARGWNGPPLRWATAVTAAVVTAGIITTRQLIVPAEGLSPSWRWLVTEYLYGPYHTLIKMLVTAPIHGQALPHWPSSIVATVLTMAGVLGLWRRRFHVGTRLFVTGAILIAILGLPLMVISGPTRVHLVVVGAALALAGGVTLVGDWIRSAPRWVAAGLVVAGAVALAHGSRQNLDGFRPCSSLEPEALVSALSLPSLSDDLRTFLRNRRLACDAGDARAPLEAAGRLRWVSPTHTVILVSQQIRGGRLLVAHPNATPDRPATIHISDGRRSERIALGAGTIAEWPIDHDGWFRRWRLGGTRIDIRHPDGPVEVDLASIAR